MGKVGKTTFGAKKDGSGKWWDGPGGKGREATRKSGDKVTHYRHSGGKVEGWTHDTRTGESSKFSKPER